METTAGKAQAKLTQGGVEKEKRRTGRAQREEGGHRDRRRRMSGGGLHVHVQREIPTPGAPSEGLGGFRGQKRGVMPHGLWSVDTTSYRYGELACEAFL